MSVERRQVNENLAVLFEDDPAAGRTRVRVCGKAGVLMNDLVSLGGILSAEDREVIIRHLREREDNYIQDGCRVVANATTALVNNLIALGVTALNRPPSTT